jgi:hypothetical protein
MENVRQRLTETETYISLLRQRRQEVRSVLDGLSSEALNWLPIPHKPGETKVTNSLYQLGYHCIVTEVDWRRHIAYRLGLITREEELRGFEEGEFEVTGENPSRVFERLERDGRETDHFVSRLTDGELAVTWLNARNEARSVRWILGHIIAHYGEHIGQMALTRQLWEKQFGGD